MSNPRLDPTHPKAIDDGDDAEGHFMGADTVPDEVRQPVEGEAEGADDDTEGHRYVTNGPEGVADDDDAEGHLHMLDKASSPEGFNPRFGAEGVADEDDTEGHRIAAYGPEGFRAMEPEGFRARAFVDEDEDDTEGHLRTRPAPEGSQPMPSGEGVQQHRDDRVV